MVAESELHRIAIRPPSLQQINEFINWNHWFRLTVPTCAQILFWRFHRVEPNNEHEQSSFEQMRLVGIIYLFFVMNMFCEWMPRLLNLTARLFPSVQSESARWWSTTTTPKYSDRYDGHASSLLLYYSRTNHDLKSWKPLENLLSPWCSAAFFISIHFLESLPSREWEQTKSVVLIIRQQQSQYAHNNNSEIFSTI